MITLLKQSDPHWANVTLGQTTLPLRSKGCVVTSLAMADSYFRLDFKFPDQLAKELKFTADGLVMWESLPQALSFRLERRLNVYDSKVIDESLRDPKRAVILEVNHGQHFVLGLKRIPLTNTYWVADPLTGTKRLYNNVCGSVNLII